MTIETPCILVCHLDPASGLCVGCGRTGEEIGGWLGYSPEHRRTIMDGLAERLRSLSAPTRSAEER